jgi:hypothetical protein
MGSGKEEPPELGPEAREALSQFRKGIARARTIISAARQAIGRPDPRGVLLTGAPEADAPEQATAEPPAEPPPVPRPEQP